MLTKLGECYYYVHEQMNDYFGENLDADADTDAERKRGLSF